MSSSTWSMESYNVLVSLQQNDLWCVLSRFIFDVYSFDSLLFQPTSYSVLLLLLSPGSIKIHQQHLHGYVEVIPTSSPNFQGGTDVSNLCFLSVDWHLKQEQHFQQDWQLDGCLQQPFPSSMVLSSINAIHH
jgi:hypothetical protein